MRDRNFPLWRRLHIYWRTLPQYNQFWKGTSTSSSSTTPGFQSSLPRTPTQNRFRPRPGNSENDLIYVSSREPSGGGRKGSSVSRSSRSASLDYSYRDRLDTARPGPSTDRRAFTAQAAARTPTTIVMASPRRSATNCSWRKSKSSARNLSSRA